jgi:hypothetical protein
MSNLPDSSIIVTRHVHFIKTESLSVAEVKRNPFIAGFLAS